MYGKEEREWFILPTLFFRLYFENYEIESIYISS